MKRHGSKPNQDASAKTATTVPRAAHALPAGGEPVAVVELVTASPARAVDAVDTEREEAARVTAEAERVHAEAERLRLEAETEKREALQLADQIRAEADRYSAETHKVLEESRAALLAETTETRAAMARELAELREHALQEARRDAGLPIAVESLENAQHALQEANKKVAAVAAVLAANGHGPTGAAGPMANGAAVEIDSAAPRVSVMKLSPEDAAAVARFEASWPQMKAAVERFEAVLPKFKGAADQLEARPARTEFVASSAAAPRWPGLLVTTGLIGLGGMMAVVVAQVGTLQSHIEEQQQSIARLVTAQESRPAPPEARAPSPPPPAAAAPHVDNAAAPPTTAPEPSAPAAAAPPAEKPAVAVSPAPAPTAPVPAPAAPAAVVEDQHDTTAAVLDKASLSELLNGHSASEWQKKRVINAGRRALRNKKIEQAQMDAIIAAVDARPVAPMNAEELEDLKKIHRAQKVLVNCKAIEAGGFDLQLGAGTRARLKELANGDLTCTATDPTARAALDALKKDLSTASWQSFLDDARSESIAKSVLLQ